MDLPNSSGTSLETMLEKESQAGSTLTALLYVCSVRTHCHNPPKRPGRQSCQQWLSQQTAQNVQVTETTMSASRQVYSYTESGCLVTIKFMLIAERRFVSSRQGARVLEQSHGRSAVRKLIPLVHVHGTRVQGSGNGLTWHLLHCSIL